MQEGNNGQINYLFERAQKLTEALYRVTDLMSDHEPLKWFLRRFGLQIFEDLLEVKTAAPNERIKGLDLATDKISQMVRTLGLASSGSFISEANFQTLCREYGALVEFILSQKTDFLSIGQPIGHISNGQNDKNEKVENEVNQVNEPNNEINAEKTDDGGRREKILSFIKEKDWVSIGELAKVFEGQTSEKTLQRDLSGLAGEGLLLKEGEKRWRRYKLARG